MDPAVTEIDPEDPPVAAPVAITSAPDDNAAEVPVSTTTLPEDAPAARAFDVRSHMLPED